MSKVKVFLWNDRLKNYQYVNVNKRSWIISIAKTVWVKVLTKKKSCFHDKYDCHYWSVMFPCLCTNNCTNLYNGNVVESQ